MIRQISKRKMLAQSKNSSLFYHKGNLYIGDPKGGNQIFLCKIPLSGMRKVLVKMRFTERMLRLEPRIACDLPDDNYILSCSGAIYRVDAKSKMLCKELQLRSGMNNPLSFTRRRAGKPDEELLFGEYFSNNEKQPVSIYSRINGQWNCVYTFPAGRVYHIHGIVADDEKGWVYILTGDQDQESAIWCTTNNFRTVEPLVQGNQQYRSCVAFPIEDGLIYATDTPREENHLNRLHQEAGAWRVESVCTMPGPCIYGTQRTDGWYFATSVEGDDTLSSMRYRFSNKLGEGVQDRYSHLIHCDRAGNVREIARLKKDMLPMLLFQFGNCSFPEAPQDAPLLCTPLSVMKYDGKTICIELGE